MNEVVFQILSSFLIKVSTNYKIGNSIFYGDNCILVPVEIDFKNYYCKIFITTSQEVLESEVKFVNFLINHGIHAPAFWVLNDTSIFFSDSIQFPAFFYFTQEIENDGDVTTLSDKLIKQIVMNIGELHLKTMEFTDTLPGIKKVADYQSLISLYIKHKKKCQDFGFSTIIEEIIFNGPNRVSQYPIHSDIYSKNILTVNNKFRAFIDFSDLRISSFEDDLGKFMQNLVGAKGIPVNSIERYIQIYENYTNTRIDRRNLFISIIYRVLERFFDKCFWKRDLDYECHIKCILSELFTCYKNHL